MPVQRRFIAKISLSIWKAPYNQLSDLPTNHFREVGCEMLIARKRKHKRRCHGAATL